MSKHYDVAIVGGGIVGLAHASMAARRQLKVLLLDRSPSAQGASVRNFGMIWPVGQPAGELYSIALKAREFWLELGTQGVLEVERCGSIHVAHQPDELAVLEEFCAKGTHSVEMLNPEQTIERAPLVNPSGLLGGMWSPTELRVDPRTASARIAAWLAEQHGVDCCFNTPITRIENSHIHASDGRQWTAEKTIICSGSDLETLYPDVLQNSGLVLCKLQMLKSLGVPPTTRPAAHIASGLTLRHYTSFRECPSLQSLQNRIADESPELDRFGIHVMASQFPSGEIILGDSHEYGDQITPFDRAEIDELMLRALKKIIRLENWNITERWHGIYAKHPTLPVFESLTDDGVRVFVGTGGAGMTMSFGLADRAWNNFNGAS